MSTEGDVTAGGSRGECLVRTVRPSLEALLLAVRFCYSFLAPPTGPPRGDESEGSKHDE